jgi:hypothetical protein
VTPDSTLRENLRKLHWLAKQHALTFRGRGVGIILEPLERHPKSPLTSADTLILKSGGESAEKLSFFASVPGI